MLDVRFKTLITWQQKEIKKKEKEKKKNPDVKMCMIENLVSLVLELKLLIL